MAKFFAKLFHTQPAQVSSQAALKQKLETLNLPPGSNTKIAIFMAQWESLSFASSFSTTFDTIQKEARKWITLTFEYKSDSNKKRN
jgi:hypothetical protein